MNVSLTVKNYWLLMMAGLPLRVIDHSYSLYLLVCKPKHQKGGKKCFKFYER